MLANCSSSLIKNDKLMKIIVSIRLVILGNDYFFGYFWLNLSHRFECDYCAQCWYKKGEEEENILQINYFKIKRVKIDWTTNMKKYHEFCLPFTTMHLKSYFTQKWTFCHHLILFSFWMNCISHMTCKNQVCCYLTHTSTYAWHSVDSVLVNYYKMFLVIWTPLYTICYIIEVWSKENINHIMFTNDIINLLNLDFAGLPLTNQGMWISNLWEKMAQHWKNMHWRKMKQHWIFS